MTPKQQISRITKWIKNYATKNRVKTLVIGVSGGIDSAVVSTLCAKTGLPVIAVSMPIKQSKATHSLSVAHGEWLTENFENVQHRTVDLTPTFKQFEKLFESGTDLAFANSRSRLRMICLYQIAQDNGGIVVGTGNKVEDFGVGFFTKYGDGGVDISPIGDCLKTQVWAMGRELEVLPEIIDADPTDGLLGHGAGRTDHVRAVQGQRQVLLGELLDGEVHRGGLLLDHAVVQRALAGLALVVLQHVGLERQLELGHVAGRAHFDGQARDVALAEVDATLK